MYLRLKKKKLKKKKQRKKKERKIKIKGNVLHGDSRTRKSLRKINPIFFLFCITLYMLPPAFCAKIDDKNLAGRSTIDRISVD